MKAVPVQCYGCPAVVKLEANSLNESLNAAGWRLVHGETYCPSCAAVRGLTGVAEPVKASSGPTTAVPGSAGSTNAAPETVIGANSDASATAASSPVKSRESSYAVPLVPGRAPSREALRVAALRSRARWLILAGIALAIAGAFGSSETSRGAPRLASVLGLFCGVAFAYLGVRWSALLARAQKVLEEPPLELLLTRWRTSYAYTFMWNAVLYSSGSEANPMASLNRNWQWPMPLWWAPRQVPALVYGALSHRGVVVVSADDGFLVARVACSESDGDARWAQHLEWLLKPRSLPGSGR